MLIDEFENAVHASLLGELSLLIQDLAQLFNIQVFITTHSKECVDAFIQGGCDTREISGYGLGIADGKAYVRHVPGETFQEWLEAFGADLRVVR